jgi:hypothetical protein
MSPTELLKEVVMVDDFSDKGLCDDDHNIEVL